MKKLVAVIALAGCTDVVDGGTPWMDAATIEGMELGPDPTLRAAPGCTVRIASWNLHKLPDPDDVLAHYLTSTEIAAADVILVQETSWYPGEANTRTAQLADQMAMTWAHSPVRVLPDGVNQGNAIISRHPLERVQVMRLPYIEQIYSEQERSVMAADVVLGDHRLRVMTIHLDVRLQITDRIRQLDPAVTSFDERAVVGGDFNTAPWQWVEALVPLTSTQAAVGLSQAAVLDDYMRSRNYTSAISPETNTFTAPGFGMRLDNLYSRSLPIIAAGIEHVGGSDHWPIWVDVDLCR